MAEEQLKPEAKEPEIVHERLQYYKNLQKKSYDHGARNLPVLNQGDVVRIRGEKGFPLKGIVERKSEHPRSYLVKTSSGTHSRNRRHLLKVVLKDPKLRIWIMTMEFPKEGNGNINPGKPSVKEPSTTKEQVQAGRQIVSRQNNDTENENLNVYTRSGRLVKRPERLNL